MHGCIKDPEKKNLYEVGYLSKCKPLVSHLGLFTLTDTTLGLEAVYFVRRCTELSQRDALARRSQSENNPKQQQLYFFRGL